MPEDGTDLGQFQGQGWRQSVRHMGKKRLGWGWDRSGSLGPNCGVRPSDKERAGGSRRLPGFCVSRPNLSRAGEISGRSMTGWVCVKKREEWEGFM